MRCVYKRHWEATTGARWNTRTLLASAPSYPSRLSFPTWGLLRQEEGARTSRGMQGEHRGAASLAGTGPVTAGKGVASLASPSLEEASPDKLASSTPSGFNPCQNRSHPDVSQQWTFRELELDTRSSRRAWIGVQAGLGADPSLATCWSPETDS